METDSNSNPATFILGIDLGTTNSAVAVFREGEVAVMSNALGESLTPSVVARDPEDGRVIVGQTAKEISLSHPDCAASVFKRDMASEREYALAGAFFTPIELSAFVLKSLKSDALRVLGQEVCKAVITVPAYFAEEQRQATKRAGELAGLEVVRILNEPTAAAMAYGLHRRDRDGSFLVFDLGGGTFDVSIMELFEGSLEVLSTAGESRLGGEDFTRRLISYGMKQAGVDPSSEWSDPVAFARLYRRAELAKRALSEHDTATLEVPPFGGDGLATTIVLDREVCRPLWQELLDRIAKPCRTAVRGADLEIEDLDEVVLVGGATRMPVIRELVAKLFDVHLRVEVDPDLAITEGAALQAALYANDQAVSDVVVTDVLSHSLGVDVSYEIAGKLINGNFSPVIHRNTTIPTSRTETYYTIFDQQTEINFGIYEGEARKVKNCRKVGLLKVKGVPKNAAGKEGVEVRFTYDLGGMLEVEAKVLSSGKIINKVFERSLKPLSDKERSKAMARLKQLKVDPSEKALNRDLLARADGLLEEVGPEARDQLEYYIRGFEEALETRTPRPIKETRRQLREVCDRIDEGNRW
ncbi:MAG: Hsp70 family protein [Planctomycetota bacterium]